MIKITSELLKTAQNNRQNLMLVVREDGTQTEINEDAAWEEIKYLGMSTECYAIMKDKYPEAFAASEEHSAKVKEMSDFTLKNFGIRHDRVRISDIMRIVEGMVEYKAGGTVE